MFFPGVDYGSEHDCDMMPMLMEAVGQKANAPDAAKGVAVDVGASEGMCTLLLLSKGYTVYSYEPAPLYQVWREMSVNANPGFGARARLRAGLQGGFDRGSKLTLDSEFLEAADAPHRVHLLKIDVDDAEASVLHGGQKLLQSGRVDMVQIELWKDGAIDNGPVAKSGPCRKDSCAVTNAKRKAFLLGLLENHGYQLYVLRAWGASAHPQVFFDQGHKCNDLRWRLNKYKDFQAGGPLGSQYQYGDHQLHALGLIPISPLAKHHHHTAKIELLNCFSQFLAIRKSSPFLERLHARALNLIHEDNAIRRLHL